MTLLTDVLLADVSPKYVVVGQAFPLSVDLRRAAKRGGVKVAEDLETHFARKNSERVYTDEGAELFREERELGEAAHGQEAAKDEGATGMWGGRVPTRPRQLLL